MGFIVKANASTTFKSRKLVRRLLTNDFNRAIVDVEGGGWQTFMDDHALRLDGVDY